MATNITAQSVLEKISQGHLECQICIDRFKEPKMLKCLHSFCLECLQQLAEKESSSGQIVTCPFCRRQTFLTGKGVADLKTDFKLAALLEEIRQHENALENQQEQGQGYVPKCSQHTDKDLIMYCIECKTLVCTTCIGKDHTKHTLIELSESLDKCKKDVTELLAKLEQNKLKFKMAAQGIGMSLKTLDSMLAITKEKISRKAGKEVAKIRQEERQLKQEAEQIHEDRVKTFKIAQVNISEEMIKADHKVNEVNQVMDPGKCESLTFIAEVLRDLKISTEIQPDKLPVGLAFMDFEEGEESLGRLVLQDEPDLQSQAFIEARQHIFKPCATLKQENWTLKTEMRKYVSGEKQIEFLFTCDVAAFSNSEIVVSDSFNGSLITVQQDSNEPPQRLPIEGLTNPRNVAVNRDDETIVLSIHTVKVYNKNNRLLHQFTPGKGSGSQPSCLAVTDDDTNEIAVGYQNTEEISLHKLDGSLIRTLPASGIDRYLTFHKQQFIYTIKQESKLVSVDFTGRMVFSTDIQHGQPLGVCCDWDGSIFVVVQTKTRGSSSSGEIQHYSPDGKYIGCIIKECGDPWGIALTPYPANHLVVAACNAVKIYQRE